MYLDSAKRTILLIHEVIQTGCITKLYDVESQYCIMWYSFETKVCIIGIDINYDVHSSRIYCVTIQ